MNNTEKKRISPEETGGFLYYFVGSKTDELLNESEKLKRLGLAEVDRDDLYLEMAILNMFIMIKQYTNWEKDEEVYTKTLDHMHFMLFHQLKEYSNYDEDDIKLLHEHIFKRYSEYGEAIERNSNTKLLEVLCRIFLENLNDEINQLEEAINLLCEETVNFYQAIPSMLDNL